MHRRIIHFDLDGVLADFRKGFTDNFGVSPESMTSDEMWTRIAAQPEFFLKLDVLKSGFELIELAKSLGEVRVLTALPRKATYALAEDEKRRWAAMHLGSDIPLVAVQFASQKPRWARAGDILIDDAEENVRRWNKAGGIGIVHTYFDTSASALLAAFN
jgi:5'(3')-deoxyribonucleotidase